MLRFWSVLTILLATGVLADQAHLIREINQNTAPTSSYPDHFLSMGGLTFFNTTESNGTSKELWVTDGTDAGTIRLGPANSATSGSEKVVWNGRVWYLTGTAGEIGSTDGTLAGTQAFTLPSGVSASSLMAGAEYLYFFNGSKLWRTDGNILHTTQMSSTDFAVPFNGLQAQEWTTIGQNVYFAAFTSNGSVSGLWRISGNSVTNIQSVNYPLYSFRFPVTIGSLFYFQKLSSGGPHSELWRSDGTAAGTYMIKVLGGSSYLTLLTVGSDVYFVGDDGSGSKLWRTDGTVAGTTAVLTSIPGWSTAFDAIALGVLPNGTMLFKSSHVTSPGSTDYWGLWAYDGTNLTDISHVKHGNTSWQATIAGNYAFFGSGDGFMRTDGTAAGTLKFGQNGTDGTHNWPMIAAGDKVFFLAQDSVHGYELWRSDGSEAGTALFKDLDFTTYGSSPSQFIRVHGGVVFTASSDYINGAQATRDLWFTDGTDAGTTKILLNARLNWYTSCGGRAYFSNQTNSNGSELWSSDGTSGGTALIKDIYPGSDSGSPNSFACVDGHLLFMARSTATSTGELWRSDGTANGTLMVKPMPPNEYCDQAFNGIAALGHIGIFARRHDCHMDLWRTDGTPAGTVKYKDVLENDIPEKVVVAGDRVFLSGRQSSNIVLTATDGTAANTLNVLSSTTYLVPHAEFNGKLAVANNGGTSGTTGLGLVDGAGNFTIFDPAYSSNSRFGMLPLNGKLFYNFSSLHATDGVTSYDTAVTGIDQLLRSASGRIYARKDGAGLLETNGAPSGTQTLLATPNTTEVEANVGRLFIAADEPYVYDLPVTATSFAPTSVDVAGGQSIAITGRGFTSPATVFVNGVVATGTGVTATTITFIAPPHEAGTYEVSLTLGDDRHFSLDTPLTYTCAAPAAAIAPLTGGVAPSTAVTLAGSGGTRCAWFPPIGLDDPSSCTPKATLTASMTFTLMVFNAAGCPSENNPSVRVRVSPPIPTSVRATADSATHVAVSWNASAGATQYEIARASADSPLAVIGTSASASFSDTSAAAGSIYIYRVRAIGPDATSPYSSGDFAATAAFTDDPIVPRQTVIKSAHITELRNVIDGIRVLAGLQSMTWSDAGVGATIRASQISELRTALAEALTAVGAPAASYTRSIVTGGVIRASDLQDVRAAIR